MGVSAGYPGEPIPDHILEAVAWVWRKATSSELKRFRREDPAMYRHCIAGGLVLDPLPTS
jgi:hypothetical protein